jgi:exodeoxyribonuclease V alpha subunit
LPVIRNTKASDNNADASSLYRPDQMAVPVPGTAVKIEASCQDIIYRNEDNGYAVAVFLYTPGSPGDSDVQTGGYSSVIRQDKRAAESRSFTATGSMPFLEPGDFARLSGTWVLHNTYGMQLQVDHFSQIAPRSPEAILQYLASGTIHGLGPKLAEKIVGLFGHDTIRIIREEPMKLSRIKGITQKKAREISVQVIEKSDYQELAILLTPYGLGVGKILSIFRRFGASSLHVVKSNPYRLADEVYGIGFRTADALAAQFGCDPTSSFRMGSALLYCLSQAENEGHTYLPLPQLFTRMHALLASNQSQRALVKDNGEVAEDSAVAGSITEKIGSEDFSVELYQEGFRQTLASKSILAYRIDGDGVFAFTGEKDTSDNIRVAFPKTLEAEIASAKMIALKLAQMQPEFEPEQMDTSIADTSEKMNVEMDTEQKNAVQMAARSYVSIITGGPGTGKTTIIRVLTDYFMSHHKTIVLCAPTGRAAKRMTEVSGIPAKTIHRLLEMERAADANSAVVFKRNEDNPIEADVIIVDEVSMLDASLLQHLFCAVDAHTQIVFVGDQDQLPSVGPGNVLSDMICSNSIPMVTLTQIYRQTERSRIVLNAHRVLNGQSIVFDQALESDCMLIHMETPEQIAQAVSKLCSQVLPVVYGIDVIRDAMVLCPSRKGPSGVTSLNPLLQKAAGNTTGAHIDAHGFSFRVRDKVMQTRNHYDAAYKNPDGTQGSGVFNGELGMVSEVDQALDCLTVEMDDGRKVIYDRTAIEDLDPAYAVTVHKSQGSEFPVVILAIAPGSPMLNNRNLLYTAITRARKRLFIVTAKDTLDRMIRNKKQSSRMTSFCDWLRIYTQKDI